MNINFNTTDLKDGGYRLQVKLSHNKYLREDVQANIDYIIDKDGNISYSDGPIENILSNLLKNLRLTEDERADANKDLFSFFVYMHISEMLDNVQKINSDDQKEINNKETNGKTENDEEI